MFLFQNTPILCYKLNAGSFLIAEFSFIVPKWTNQERSQQFNDAPQSCTNQGSLENQFFLNSSNTPTTVFRTLWFSVHAQQEKSH